MLQLSEGFMTKWKERKYINYDQVLILQDLICVHSAQMVDSALYAYISPKVLHVYAPHAPALTIHLLRFFPQKSLILCRQFSKIYSNLKIHWPLVPEEMSYVAHDLIDE